MSPRSQGTAAGCDTARLRRKCSVLSGTSYEAVPHQVKTLAVLRHERNVHRSSRNNLEPWLASARVTGDPWSDQQGWRYLVGTECRRSEASHGWSLRRAVKSFRYGLSERLGDRVVVVPSCSDGACDFTSWAAVARANHSGTVWCSLSRRPFAFPSAPGGFCDFN